MPLSQSQIEARRTGLGCSELSSVLGLNPYRGEFDVWARLSLPDVTIDETDPDGTDDDPREWGNLLEEPIARKYAAREHVEVVTSAASYRHATAPIVGHPDRLVLDPARGLEIKASDSRMAHRWGPSESDEYPDEHRVQMIGYMALTGLARWDLAALIGGNKFRVYRLARDLAVEAAIIEEVTAWWERHIVAGERPAISGSPQALKWLAVLYPKNLRPLVEPTDELVRLAREFGRFRAHEKESKESKEKIGAEIREALAEAEGFVVGLAKKPAIKVTWKANKDGSKVAWEDVATELGASPEVIEKHTHPTIGARVLRVTGTEISDGE